MSGPISLRLPESLKAAVEAAAAQEGISTNAWLVRTIAHMLHTRSTRRPGRNRMQGYAQG
jgi:predicted HicB family RNase H-like nuclease